MTTEQAAVALGKTAWWVRRQCASGEIRAAFYGGTWNITQEAINAYIAAHLNKAKPVSLPIRRRYT